MHAALPTPHNQIRQALKPRHHLALRRLFRQLLQDSGAAAVILRLREEIVEWAGDDQALPRRFPWVDRTVPCLEETTCRSGESEVVATLRVRTLPGMPSLSLFVVGPTSRNAELFAQMEAVEQGIEEVVLEAL